MHLLCFIGWKEKKTDSLFNFETAVKEDIVLVAVWDKIVIPEEFEVKFETNGGGIISPVVVCKGEPVFEPKIEPIKEGYNFIGWYKTDEQEIYDFNSPVENDITLNARWEAIPFTVSFSDDSSLYISMSCDSENEYELPAEPQKKEGYCFLGWMQVGTENLLSPDQKKFSLSYNPEGYSFVAVWEKEPILEPELITVSFFNEKTLISKQIYEANKEYNVPDVPAVPYGYTFGGWKLRESSYVISSDKKTFALNYSENEYVFEIIWNELPIYVSFWNGEDLVEKNCFNRETTYATPNISMKNGFLFCGWEDIESGKIYHDTFSMAYSSKEYVLNAVWRKTPINVSFYNNDTLYLSDQYEYDVDNTFPPGPTPEEGYYFVGWKQVGSEKVFDSFNLPYSSESYMFEAMWEKTPFTVSFYIDDKVFSKISCIADDKYTFPLPEKRGYRFIGWKLEGEENIISSSTETFSHSFNNSGYKYYSEWEPLGISVSFYFGDELVEKRGCENDALQSFPSIEMNEGFVLEGWFVEGSSKVMSGSTFSLPYSEEEYKVYAYVNTDLLDISSDGCIRGTNTLKNSSTITSLTIPSSIKGIFVKSIENEAFKDCTYLKSITIPNSIVFIGDSSFENCCSLSSFVIPENIVSIEDYSFKGCSSLSSMIIPETVKTIGNGAFSDCSMLTQITILGILTHIDLNPFDGCSKLLTINAEAFTKKEWRDLTKNTELSPTVTIYLADGQKDGKIEEDGIIYCVNKETFERYVYKSTDNYITEAMIKNEVEGDIVTSIGEKAFYYCNKLVNITFGSNITSIGNEAFYNCNSITDFVISDSVVSIGEAAFFGCDKLKSITIGSNVSSIGYGAFNYCRNLLSINVKDDNDNFQSIDGVLFDKKLEVIICYPRGKTESEYVIPDTVTTICEDAFYGSKLSRITIPNSVVSIEKSAFSSSSNLIKINIPEGVVSINDCLFYGCCNLSSISIPNGVYSIGEYAFYGCSSLSSITIPYSVSSVGSNAFRNCDKLTRIVVGRPKGWLSGAPWGGNMTGSGTKRIDIVWPSVTDKY